MSTILVWCGKTLEKLKKFAQSAKNPYTDTQIIDFALQLIRNTRDFEQGLIDWDKKPTADKTWANLKSHFKQAQQDLRKARGPSMVQAGFAHANHLAQEIRQEIKDSNTELANMLAAYEVKETAPPTPATGSLSDMTDSANSATENKKLMQRLDEMQKQMIKSNA